MEDGGILKTGGGGDVALVQISNQMGKLSGKKNCVSTPSETTVKIHTRQECVRFKVTNAELASILANANPDKYL